MKITAVSKSQFKPRAFEYFRMVEHNGDTIRVTDHGKPVADIVPYRGNDDRLLAELRGLVNHFKDPLAPLNEAWEADA